MVNHMLRTGAVDDDILLGVTASCLVMHFWFDQYYYQCKRDPSATQIAVMTLAPDSSSQTHFSLGALLFSFDSFIVLLCCGSSSSSFVLKEGEFAGSGHVSWSLCASGMNKLTCSLTGRLTPN